MKTGIKKFFQVQLDELFEFYETKEPSMYFEIKKVNNDFIITNISKELLEILHLNLKDVIGQSINTIFSVTNADQKIQYQQIYQLAFEGQSVLFYYEGIRNSELSLLSYITPEYYNMDWERVRCRCVTFSNKTVNNILKKNTKFVVLW